MATAVPRMLSGQKLLVGFLAGVLSVAVFHQAAVFLVGLSGLGEGIVYSFRPTQPLGVPRLISQMFWGGLWGILFAAMADRLPGRWPLAVAGFLFGVAGPALVGLLVITPLRGQSMAAGLMPQRLASSILINGTFGVGLALIFARLRGFAAGDDGRAPP
jgi:hypothetical protein